MEEEEAEEEEEEKEEEEEEEEEESVVILTSSLSRYSYQKDERTKSGTFQQSDALYSLPLPIHKCLQYSLTHHFLSVSLLSSLFRCLIMYVRIYLPSVIHSPNEADKAHLACVCQTPHCNIFVIKISP
jgi:hypothetical protein